MRSEQSSTLRHLSEFYKKFRIERRGTHVQMPQTPHGVHRPNFHES